MEYLAHTSGARVQTLLEHLEGTAELAERFGAAFGSGDFARMTALAHDLGKYSSAFQRRLRGDPGRVDHSTFGAPRWITPPPAPLPAGVWGSLWLPLRRRGTTAA